ncbi:MAG TPA: VWA domain-containing protein, partial [Thermoanaerobaculia bacterium]|nr:VWA domain-containing protein [Thermoanaerobaculia bacterium]
GKPVRGLTAADFEVYQGRNPQAITGFEVLDLAAVPAGNPEAVRRLPMSARRRFVLMFDLGFSSPAAMTKARQAAKDILRGSFHPTDLVAVAAYVPSRGPEFLLGFTTDHRSVEAAIDRLSPVQRGFAADPLLLAPDIYFSDLGGDEAPKPGLAVMERADPEGAGTNVALPGTTASISATMAIDRSEREAARSRLTAFTRALGAFANALASVDGRKHVIFLSEGFDSSLAMGSVDEAEIQEMNDASILGESWNIDNDKRYGNTKASADLDKMIEALRRADCVVQAVDIGGVRASADDLRAARSKGADGLFMVANSTGGELYQNFNDLSAAMEKMLERTSVTYVLSIQPDVKNDGEYHKIRVALKGDRGARVVYRAGYYAPRPFAQRSAAEKMLQTAGQVVSGLEGGPVGLSVLAAPFKAKGAKAYVPVLIEIDGASLTAGSQGTVPAEVYVYAMNAQGAVQDFFTQSMALDLAKVGGAVRGGGLKFFGDLDLPEGAHSIRVLVRNGQTGASGMRVASLEVPAFSKGGPVLLPPFFPEPAGRWLVVREAKLRQGEVDYPFLSQEKPYIPASRPVLSAGREVQLSLVGYGLGAGQLTAHAMVMTPDGKEAGEGTIAILGRESAAAAGGPDRLAATFRAPSLQPGEYLLLVTLTGPRGSAETSVAPFVVAAGAH